MRHAHHSVEQTLRIQRPNTQQHRSIDGKWRGCLQVAGARADVGEAPASRTSRLRCRARLLIWPLLRGRQRALFDLPIRRRVFDSPEVAGHIEFQPNQPGLGIAAQRNHLPYPCRGVPFCRNDFQPDLNALRQRAWSDQPASVRVHQGGVARFGKWHGGIEAGQEHGNFQRQPSAAPNGVLVFSRKAHRVSRQKVLRPENLELRTRNDLKASAGNSGNNCPPPMLDHGKAPGTEFRCPRFPVRH